MSTTTPAFPDSAIWIAAPFTGGPRTTSPAPHLRRGFMLPAKPVKAILRITALGVYEAHINGRRVGDEVLAPGWTDYRVRVRYQTHDITALLRSGANAIGVILGDGWYCGHTAINDRQRYGDRPRLLAELEWTLKDGTTATIATDSNWRTASGPILESDLMMGEAYDARLELGAWSSPEYDDSGWQAVITPPAPATIIEPQAGPPVKAHEVLKAAPLPPTRPGAAPTLFDLGQNIAGRARIAVRGKRGATLRLRFGEMLDAHGQLYTENLRSARAIDYYTLKGDGIEVWEPRFTFHGFRYVEATWNAPHPNAGTVEGVEGIALYSDMARTGHFECSHPLLNKLYQNTVWGQKGNFLDIPTDCPQRDERLGWTGDAQAFARTAAFNMDVSAFFHKWLQDLRDAQSPEGAIPAVAPFGGEFGLPDDGRTGWADAAFIVPWQLYLIYGDERFLRDQYPSMTRYMGYLVRHRVKDHIRGHPEIDEWGGFGDWLALDGSGKIDGGTPKELLGTAFYANNARILADSARVLGMPKEAKKWDALRTKIAAAFRSRFVTPEGLLAAGTQTACVLALWFDLLEPRQRAGAAEQLVALIRKNGWRIGTGFLGTPYILHVLEQTGHLDVAYRLLEQEEFPSWLFPVKNGATTIWERWDGWTPEKGFQDKGMNSFNHYAYGAVCDWMVSTVAGLEPAAPGYARIRFKPRPGGGITRAKASLVTRHGKASIEWSLARGRISINVVVPPGATAYLDPLPHWRVDGPTKLAPGRHRLKVDCGK